VAVLVLRGMDQAAALSLLGLHGGNLRSALGG